MKIMEFQERQVMIRDGKLTGLVKKNGNMVQIKSHLFFVYVDRDNNAAYLVAPETGVSVFNYYETLDEYGDLLPLSSIIAGMRSELDESDLIEKYEKLIKRKSYKMGCLAYKAYQKAERFMEMHFEQVRKENE